jgi:hypothetical protein
VRIGQAKRTSKQQFTLFWRYGQSIIMFHDTPKTEPPCIGLDKDICLITAFPPPLPRRTHAPALANATTPFPHSRNFNVYRLGYSREGVTIRSFIGQMRVHFPPSRSLGRSRLVRTYLQGCAAAPLIGVPPCRCRCSMRPAVTPSSPTATIVPPSGRRSQTHTTPRTHTRPRARTRKNDVQTQNPPPLTVQI